MYLPFALLNTSPPSFLTTFILFLKALFQVLIKNSQLTKMAAKKVVLNVQVHAEKEKQKALKAVCCLSGIESIAMDMKEKKLTVIGDVDPVKIVGKLRKSWCTEILTVGPAKEEKKDDQKGDGKNEKQIAEPLKLCREQNPYYTQCYHVYSAEENPNSCVLC